MHFRKTSSIVLTLVLVMGILLAPLSMAPQVQAAPTAPTWTGSYFKDVYYATEATLSGGAVIGAKLYDFTAGGYVDGLPNNASITYNVTVPQTARYAVGLRYTNGTGAAKTVGVYANGVKILDATLNPTINGTTWYVQRVNLPLTTGANIITLRNEEGNNCDEVRFDKITLTYIFEAEDATVINDTGTLPLIQKNPVIAARTTTDSGTVSTGTNPNGIGRTAVGASGDYMGTFYAQGAGSASATAAANQGLEFNVNVPVAGTYALVLRYAAGALNNGSARTLNLSVNGVSANVSINPTRDWDCWEDFTQEVTLNAGDNTILIRRTSSPSTNGEVILDYIMLSPTQWMYAGEVQSIAGNGTPELAFNLNNSRVSFKSVAKNSVRIWLEPAADSVFSRKFDSFTVINEAVDPQNLTAVDRGGYYEIDAGSFLAMVNKDPFKLTYVDKDTGKIIYENQDNSMGWTSDGQLIVNSVLPEEEQFWGLGEKSPKTFTYRGTRQINWSHDVLAGNNNSYVPTVDEGRWYLSNPYFVSSNGYSILFDNTGRTVFDFGKADAETTSFGVLNPTPSGQLIYYFTYGPDLKQLNKTFSDYAGKTFFAPEFTYGNMQCKYGYVDRVVTSGNNRNVRPVVQAYRDAGIPLDGMYVDIEWYQNLCSPSIWNSTNFPDPAGLIAYFASLNSHFGVIDDPNITSGNTSIHEANWQTSTVKDFTDGMENGYFLHGRNGGAKLVDWNWGSHSGLTDFFNPEARKWWGSLHDYNTSIGVEYYWLDMNEPCRYTFDWMAYNGFWAKDKSEERPYLTFMDFKNAFALAHTKAMSEYTRGNGKRALLTTRSGYLGNHRYAAPWTGDVSGYFTRNVTDNNIGLDAQIRIGVNMSLTGYNYWGWDVGGFATSMTTQGVESYMRWIEAAVLTPIHRFHCQNSAGAKEPYYNADTTAVAKKFINLRYRLKPYMYSLTADNILGIGIEDVGYSPAGSGGTGYPFTRPMVLEFPNDKNTWTLDKQYMAGPSLLVAPVVDSSNPSTVNTTTSATSKNVYLPEGKWYDYFNSGTVFDGGRTVNYPAPLDVLPMFVKEGSIIPMYPEMQYWDPSFVDRVTLDIYPLYSNGDFRFVQYEDDGETLAYLDGEYTTTNFDCNISTINSTTSYKLNIGARTGSFTDIAARDYLLQFHGGPMDLSKLSTVKSGTTDLVQRASLAALEEGPTGYYVDLASDICYVKIPDNAQATSVTVIGYSSLASDISAVAGISAPAAVDLDLGQMVDYTISLNNVNGTNFIEIEANFDQSKLLYEDSFINIPAAYGASFFEGPSFNPVTGEYKAIIALMRSDTLLQIQNPQDILTVRFKPKSAVVYGDQLAGYLTSITLSEVVSGSYSYWVSVILDPDKVAVQADTYMRYDANGDGVLDFLDISLIIYNYYLAEVGDANWEEAILYDVSNDGIIRLDDLLIICSYFH